MPIYFRLLSLILFALPVLAQQPAFASAKQTASAPKQLTVDDVIAMAAAGLSDDLIIARLRREDRAFDLTTQDLIRLKNAKVSDPVLKVMMDPTAGSVAPASQKPVIRMPMIPRIGTADRSGATPSAGASTSGDLNDPLTPHDSGIYLYIKDREGWRLDAY